MNVRVSWLHVFARETDPALKLLGLAGYEQAGFSSGQQRRGMVGSRIPLFPPRCERHGGWSRKVVAER